MLSVILITKNEQDNIERCLRSVSWADEIIVVDSGSTDDTIKICKQYTDKITITDDWPGFGQQKSRALEQASGEWVLSLDADEVVSSELKIAIERAIKQSPYDGFALARKTVFYGKVVRYADALTYPVRLFRRTQGQFDKKPVHEKIMITGSIGKLHQPLYHYSFKDIHHLIAKMNQYSSLLANDACQQGRTSSLWRASLGGLWMFLRTYLFRLGFLDGRPGLVLSMARAAGTFYKHAKIALNSR